jgi:hypothetical protein
MTTGERERQQARHAATPHLPDPRGNQRLTAMTGAVLFVLFIAECLTLLSLGKLLTLHVFLGMLLIGPVSLKIGSTLWRFTRYYTRSAPYVRRGPPELLQRVLGPFVILTTVAVIGSGVMLVVTGPGNGPWHSIHRLSFLAGRHHHPPGFLPPEAAADAVEPVGRSRPPRARGQRDALDAAGRVPGGRPGPRVPDLSPVG